MGFYLPLGVILLVSSLIALGMILMDSIMGPSAEKSQKEIPYECGVDREEDPQQNIRAPFFTVGLLFMLFGVEIVFLIIWAVQFRALGWTGFAAMSIFIGLIVLGLIYDWKKGALSWE